MDLSHLCLRQLLILARHGNTFEVMHAAQDAILDSEYAGEEEFLNLLSSGYSKEVRIEAGEKILALDKPSLAAIKKVGNLCPDLEIRKRAHEMEFAHRDTPIETVCLALTLTNTSDERRAVARELIEAASFQEFLSLLPLEKKNQLLPPSS